MRPRLRHGLPRGGIGYLGVVIGLASLVVGWRYDGLAVVIVTALAFPLCVWLGMGLRVDGLHGEATDQVVMESQHRYDWFDLQEHIVNQFRLSTLAIVFGVANLILSVWKLMHPGQMHG